MANETVGSTLPLINKKARTQLQEMTGLVPASTLEAERTDGGWRVLIDLVERTAVPDTMDLLGAYEAMLDVDGTLISVSRKRLHRRGDPEFSGDVA